MTIKFFFIAWLGLERGCKGLLPKCIRSLTGMGVLGFTLTAATAWSLGLSAVYVSQPIGEVSFVRTRHSSARSGWSSLS